MQDVAVQEHVAEERVAFRHSNRVVRPRAGPPMIPTCRSSEGTTAKLAAAVWPSPTLCQAKASALAAMSATVTHWKLMDRRGLSSDRGMKTTD